MSKISLPESSRTIHSQYTGWTSIISNIVSPIPNVVEPVFIIVARFGSKIYYELGLFRVLAFSESSSLVGKSIL